MYKQITSLMILFALCGNSQNNIIPNSGFQNTQSPQTFCATGVSSFNSTVDNWRVNQQGNGLSTWKHPVTAWINLPNCSASSGNCGFLNNPSGRFLKLASQIKGNCNKNRKDNVAVALLNNATFDNTKNFKLRIKLVRKGADASGNPIPTGCAWTFNFCQLSFFGSKKGPTNWLDNNNILEQLFLYQAGKVTNCDFQLIERNISFNSNQLTTLALQAETGGFFIDDVEVFESCDNNYIVQNKNYSFPIYAAFAVEGANFKEEAGSTLTVGNNVGGANATGDVVIGPLTYIIYTASNEIILKDGFWVQPQAEFHAVIASCPNSVSTKLVKNKVGVPADFFGDDSEEGFDESMNLISENFITTKIYPNPTTNSFAYQTEVNIQNATFKITNVLNQVVYSKTIAEETNEVNFDINELAKGIYFLNHYSVDGKLLSTNKIIKN